MKQNNTLNSPALSIGETLEPRSNDVLNLIEILKLTKLNTQARLHYIQNDGSVITQTYNELWDEAMKLASGLAEKGLVPGDKVLLQLERSQDFIPAMWACILGGFVAVPLSIASNYSQENATVNKLHNAWKMLERPLILTTVDFDKKINSLNKLFPMPALLVITVEELKECASSLFQTHLSLPDDLTLLLLTSGSTGAPKAVRLTHKNLMSMSQGYIETNKFTKNDVALNWMPLDHVGAIMLIGIPAADLTCSQVIAPIDYILNNPLRWLDLISQYRVSITWAPNFAYGLINALENEINQCTWDLSSLHFLLNAGEQIVTKTARKFLLILKQHGLSSNAMFPAYGMSETSSAISCSNTFTLNSSTNNQLFVDVGTPISGASLRIVNDKDEVLFEKETGHLQVQGSSVTSGYYANNELTKQAFTTDGWFKTGDLAYLYNGSLIITGRDKNEIIINGINYPSHEIESVIEELEDIEVSFTAACSVQDEKGKDSLAIFFVTSVTDDKALTKLLKTIRGQLHQKISISPHFLIPVDKGDIPKTTIGKIMRKQLSHRFQNDEYNDIISKLGNLDQTQDRLDNFFYQPIWIQTSLSYPETMDKSHQWLIFGADEPLTNKIKMILKQLGHSIVLVEAGHSFAKVKDKHYTLRVNQKKDYQQLFSQPLIQNVSKILHLWSTTNVGKKILCSYRELDLQDNGLYSLINIAQHLPKKEEDKQLTVITNNLLPVLGDEVIKPERSTLVGAIKIIPEEYKHIKCQLIDINLPTDTHKITNLSIHQLISETMNQNDLISAHRGFSRWIPSHKPVKLRDRYDSTSRIKQGGVYLITGGLGGMGLTLANYLAAEYQAKLILLGRSNFPEQSQWSQWLSDHDEMEVTSKKIEQLQSILAMGSELHIAQVDSSNISAMLLLIEQSEKRFGSIHGVLHCAGIFDHEGSIYSRTSRQSTDKSLEAKVKGTLVLDEVFKGKSLDFMMLSSSLATTEYKNSIPIGYCAANDFLDTFAYYRMARTDQHTCVINWSSWQQVGMLVDMLNEKNSSHEEADPAALLLKDELSPEEGAKIFNRVVQSPYPRITISREALSTMHSSQLSPKDQTKNTPETNLSYVAPRDEIETKLVEIWQRHLKEKMIGVHDDFFEIGGYSLLAIQMLHDIQKEFSSKISLNTFFDISTIEQLAKNIEFKQIEAIDDDVIQELLAEMENEK